MTAKPKPASKPIHELNDAFRTSFLGGRVVMTSGIAALGKPAVADIVQAVKAFTDFTPDNDPHGEHDFGIITFGADTIYWKIDAYDADMAFGSENPAEPAVTTRVLTIMLASEY